MISPVDALLEDFANGGADILTVHPEAGPHIYRTLERIKELGCKAGIALNPGTPLEMLEPVLPIIDLILIMTVNPGFGGQSFLESQLTKIKKARTLIEQTTREILLQVDGGISPRTAPSVIQAGADILVAGSAIFNSTAAHYGMNIQMLRGIHE